MKLVSRLSSADGFDGVDHEDSEDDDGDDEGEGGSGTSPAPTASKTPSSTAAGEKAKKKKRFNISELFNAGLFFADRLKFLCCACKKKFDREEDKIEHLKEAHEDRDQINYHIEEKRKNHAIPHEIMLGDISTFWKSCRPMASGEVECGICEETEANEDKLLGHFYDKHVSALNKHAWKPQRKAVQKYLQEQKQEMRLLQQQQKKSALKSPKPSSSKLPQQPPPQQQQQLLQGEEAAASAKQFRYIFAFFCLKTENGETTPRTFLEMAGCVKCALYFASRKDRKRHSWTAHANEPLGKYEVVPSKDQLKDFKAADSNALETLKNCSCLHCGFFFCTSASREKHGTATCPLKDQEADKATAAAAAAAASSTPSLEDGLKSDLLAAFTPKQHPKCLECDIEYPDETTKSRHNIRFHGHLFNPEMSSDDDSESEGEIFLRAYGY